jgi:mycofactocin system glycosyltransferase
MSGADAPPADLTVCLDPAARILGAGRIVAGGSPYRMLRVTAEGAQAIARWKTPAPVGDRPGHRALARRLLDAGILTPRPEPAAATSDLTVVVPVRDRAAQLARCLDAVLAACPASPVIVVDDGSVDPAALRAVGAERGARVIRHADSRGAAAARNSGLAACTTAFVGFVDSDVVLPPSAPARLLGHFADPRVGAVAPRIRALRRGGGLLGGYEERHSPLDMGSAGGLVAPGRPTPWVPSTMLLVRRSAVHDGFDESLIIGEDVDFVWRLGDGGWHVRYAPEAEAWHDHRIRLRGFVTRRHLYARSVGMLARRHPRALPAMWVSPPLTVPWALLAAGRRWAALAAAAAVVVRGGRQMRRLPGASPALACGLVARGLGATGLALAHAIRRPWAPPLLLAARRRPAARRALLAAVATAVVQDAVATRRLGPALADAPVRILDEAVAAVGTWDGCLRERTLRPLLPSRHSPDRAASR